ncbi:MAG TPA: type II toxin-antitoxin system RelE/ParE family toxin [Solirubrobacterales bacterium]|nr:type II toxin-antitoxin system RelE/ParE family toxin [Solirubrobacterales bacterium]
MTKGRKRSQPKRGRKIVARGTPARWRVAWHPKALDEKNAIEDAAERVAIAHVIEKLEVDGPALQSPHQSGVMGEEGSGLRELRPRRGRSRWRPLYRRADETLFAIFAIGPEAEIDKAGYAKAVRLAKQRLKRLEKAEEKE